MQSPVYVVSLGAISAIGENVAKNLHSLQTEKCGITLLEFLKTNYQNKLPAGEIKFSNENLADKANLTGFNSRTTLLAKIAATEALENLGEVDLKNTKKGFISANTVGGMDRTEVYFANKSTVPIQELWQHDCGASTEIVAKEIGFTDFFTTISTACSSSANALMLAARLIRANKLEVCMAGGSDALSQFTINGFNSLMILDKNLCTPFDENRNGLNLGEGAAYLILCSEKFLLEKKLKPLAILSGFANANDAFHQTASSPEGRGNFKAMQEALQASGLKTTDIDYINLHGTGTQNNDSSEGIAIENLFGKNIPKASSTKTFTGHTLGAAGSLEALFSVLAIQHNCIFPNLRFQTKLKELQFSPVQKLIENIKIKNVLSNSFGFGGNCSTLIFSAV